MNFEITNIFVNSLPGDTQEENYVRQVLNACYSLVKPSPCSKPELIAISPEVLQMIGLNQSQVNSEFIEVFSGNKILANSEPYAMCYGGHQFGHWAGQLGDGRAINIADIKAENGLLTLQLKGAGKTPYSRNADGLAVLRSSIREFLCSEAMFHLGIPTTRALSLIKTGDKVLRDMLYDGNHALEPGAIVCRVAPNFIRFGNFEIFASRKDYTNLRKLLDFTIINYYPHLGEPSKETYIEFIREVSNKTIDLIIDWHRVGFVHGVMNTDNMSILGLTIDYGPYGWLEVYDESWTPNTTDAGSARYAFGNQANIALWNIVRLINALYPLIEDKEPLQKIVDDLQNEYPSKFKQMMASKIGFNFYNDEIETCMFELVSIMKNIEIDYIIFFRNLVHINLNNEIREIPDYIKDAIYKNNNESNQRILSWLLLYQKMLSKYLDRIVDREKLMNSVNPKYVLRNYMASLAIEASEKGDNGLIHEFMEMLKHPYSDNPKFDKWFVKRPEWAAHKIGCSMLSCSS